MTNVWPRMIVTMVVSLCFLVAGCNKRFPAGKAPNASMNRQDSKAASVPSKDMVDTINARWNQDISTISSQDKDRPMKEIELLCRQLRELPPQTIKGLIDCATHVDRAPADKKDFEGVLDKALIIICLKNADKGGVIHLLASSCPEVIGNSSIEYFVVSQAPPTMEDPILLFVAAYRESPTSENKNRLLDAIRRAFRGLPPDKKSERYVDQCEEWYINNKKDLELNPEYPFNLDIHRGREVPLFRYSGNASA